MTYFSADRRLGPKSDRIENNSHPLCTAHFAPVLRRFPLLQIWILMSLEAAKIPNEFNHNPKPNYQVRGDPYVDKSPQRK